MGLFSMGASLIGGLLGGGGDSGGGGSTQKFNPIEESELQKNIGDQISNNFSNYNTGYQDQATHYYDQMMGNLANEMGISEYKEPSDNGLGGLFGNGLGGIFGNLMNQQSSGNDEVLGQSLDITGRPPMQNNDSSQNTRNSNSGVSGYNITGDYTTDEQTFGNTNINKGRTEQIANQQLWDRMQGEGVGFSNEDVSRQRDNIRQQTEESVNDEITNNFRNMNQRGLLSSSITNENAGEIAQQGSQGLANALSDLDMQAEQQRQQGIQNAINQGQGFSQLDTQQQSTERQLEQENLSRNLQQAMTNAQRNMQSDQFNAQQNLRGDQFEAENQRANQSQMMNIIGQNTEMERMPYTDAMDYLNNTEIPFRQANAGMGLERAQYNNQRRQQQFGSIGSGFQMGSELGQGTSIGSGWGGAIGGLLGGIFG